MIVVPLYTMVDAENTLKYLVPCSYESLIEISEAIKVNFVDAGHILGSASAEIFLSEGITSKKIVFSGDIGNINQPIIKRPSIYQAGRLCGYGSNVWRQNS